MTAASPDVLDRFRRDYARQRASEGRAHSGRELASLPYLTSGRLARQWQVRARTFDAFLSQVLRPMASRRGRRLRVLDLGAGNGWLSYRLALEGHRCTALDIREDEVDGLGAAAELARIAPFERVVASFERLPVRNRSMDLAVFNASLHYAIELAPVLAGAARTLVPGGCIVILDSPFYAHESDGEAMVREKHAAADATFGSRAPNLLALPFVEFLTRQRLELASALSWRRLRVRYPVWYEVRPLVARLKRRRAPSRFDLWLAEVP
jgi:SAM-dependent methyltransferase